MAPASTHGSATAHSAASVASSTGSAGERVEIGDVQRPGSAHGAQRPRDRDRLAPVDQRTAQRRVVGALPAAGVHDDAALEVRTGTIRIVRVMMPEWRSVIGLDVGGANTKAAVVDGDERVGSSRSRSRYGASPRRWPA